MPDYLLYDFCANLSNCTKPLVLHYLLEFGFIVDMSLSKLQKIVKDREAWYATVHRVAKTWTQFGD